MTKQEVVTAAAERLARPVFAAEIEREAQVLAGISRMKLRLEEDQGAFLETHNAGHDLATKDEVAIHDRTMSQFYQLVRDRHEAIVRAEEIEEDEQVRELEQAA